jgi:hypothetical protein
MHIGIWPFNPKAMDDKIKLSDIYTTESSPNISDDDTTDYNNVVNEDQCGEDEAITQLLNISTCWNKT